MFQRIQRQLRGASPRKLLGLPIAPLYYIGAQSRIIDQPRDPGGDGPHVERIDQDGGVARKFWQRGRVRAQHWRAAAHGYIALDAGKSDQVKLSHELLREVKTALVLNPDDDAAYSIRGSFYRALGNVTWFQRQLAAIFVGRIPKGGYEEAEAALKKAIAIAPDVMRHQYELGILYLDMDRQEEAQQVLLRAATLPIKVAIDRPRLAKIHELLSALSQE